MVKLHVTKTVCVFLLVQISHALQGIPSSFARPKNLNPNIRQGYSRKYIVELDEVASLAHLNAADIS